MPAVYANLRVRIGKTTRLVNNRPTKALQVEKRRGGGDGSRTRDFRNMSPAIYH